MHDIVWHSRTKEQVDAFIANPSHAVMLSGQAGSGKDTVAAIIVNSIVGAKSPYVTLIEPENNTISIDLIRSLEKLLTLKVPNNDAVNRILVIHRADTMTHEAQNALLKNIEEPPVGTLFILTSDDDTRILSTIKSRVTSIQVSIPTAQNLTEHFVAQGYKQGDITKALMQSGGLPGLTAALLQDQDHPLVAAAQSAKVLLSGDRYHKLLVVDALAKNRIEVANTIAVMQRIASIQLPNSTQETAKQWSNVSKVTYTAQDLLQKNAQPKTVLDYLCLNV